MTKQEFKQLTGVRVSDKYFWEVINQAYMESDKEKAEFCAEWKRKKGLREAYEYELNRVEELAHTYERVVKNFETFIRVAEAFGDSGIYPEVIADFKNTLTHKA